MNKKDQIKKEFMSVGYTPNESEELANLSTKYKDDAMQEISVIEATEMLVKTMQEYETQGR